MRHLSPLSHRPGRRESEEIVVCGGIVMHAMVVTFKVIQCTEYIDQREPSYQELHKQAWILRPATKRRPAGGVRAAELRDAELRRFRTDGMDD